MRVNEILSEQDVPKQEVTKVGPTEIEIKDPKSGITTKIPKRPNQPGKIERDKEGNLVLDPETPGEVPDDIEQGDEITTMSPSTQKPQGTVR